MKILISKELKIKYQALLVFVVILGLILIYNFDYAVKIFASSPVTDTFADQTKISTSTNITVENGQIKLSVMPWACGDTVAYEGGPYDTNGLTTTTGGYYRTVLINDQCWFKDNLNVGTPIGSKLADNVTLQDQTNNSTIEKYCYNYIDDDNASEEATGIADCAVYGGFYQWPETVQYSNGVNTSTGTTVAEGNIQGICPSGWHIPSDAEQIALSTALGGDSVAGGKLKTTTTWAAPNTGADNSSGFTDLASGARNPNGSFNNRSFGANFWSSSPNDSTYAWRRYLDCRNAVFSRSNNYRTYGFSVRCLKD